MNDLYNNTLEIEKPAVPSDRYCLMFEKHPLPILLIDCKGFSIVEVNKAACSYYGYNKKSFSKLNLADIDPSLRERSSYEILSIYKQEHLYTKHKLNNGTEINVEVHCRFFRHRGSSFFYLYVQDLNENKNLERTAEQFDNEYEGVCEEKTSSYIGNRRESTEEIEKEFDELKSRFISTSSHEFRTPLTTILTSSELLLMVGKNLNEEKYLEHIIKIQNSVMYMTSLLDDMLAIDKTEPGKWKFNPSRINLYDFCLKMIEAEYNENTQKHKINFKYKLKDKFAIVDDKLMQHIISNLLSNAIKYSPNGGNITLKVLQSRSNIVFIVSDKGIGISDSDQNNIFEYFFRGKNTGNIQGTGLGLSIVKRSVESHGGEIKFKSSINEGTTFYVFIPLITVV